MNCSDSYDSDLQWFGMDVRNLEVFLSVAKHLNFTRAGEEVNLAQPSVSVRIRQLENEVGLKLFEQLGKKIALTEAGLSLIPHARRVMAAVEDARQCIQELQGLERGSLRIGASTTPGMYLIPKAIASFKAQHPNIEIHLRIKDTQQIETGILNNEFDFGFVGGHLVGDEVVTLAWLVDQLVLIVPPDHNLARQKSVKPTQLLKEKFILREAGSATRATIVNYLQNSGLIIDPIMEMENPESVKKAVQCGLGIAFISKFAVETELKAKSLVAVRVSGLDIRRELKIVYRKDKHLGPAARAFIDEASISASEMRENEGVTL
jgi:DNA-binding transcriptional LysR family regulator